MNQDKHTVHASVAGQAGGSEYLMSQEVCHVRVSAFEDSEAEGTQHLLCVFVDRSEMRLHLREERGPEVADLGNR